MQGNNGNSYMLCIGKEMCMEINNGKLIGMQEKIAQSNMLIPIRLEQCSTGQHWAKVSTKRFGFTV